MKPSISRLAVLMLINLIFVCARSIDFDTKHALNVRAPPRQNSGEHEPPVVYEDPSAGPKDPPAKDPNSNTGLVAGAKATYQTIKAAIHKLLPPKWVTYATSKGQALERLLGLRPKFQGNPRKLYEVNDLGWPVNPNPIDLSSSVGKLKEVPYSGGRIWTMPGRDPVVDEDMHTGEQVVIGSVYAQKYYSPKEAISSFIHNGEILDLPISRATIDKRSFSIESLADANDTGPSQTPADIFQEYLQVFYATEVLIGDAINPVLNNITSQTNSTLVHDMARSIYSDLTGSTTALIGPFNNGMSFLSNTTASHENSTITMIEGIYTEMWVRASAAANSTGLYEQQLYIASCLISNDTSVYPYGFTTAQKG